MEISWVLSEDYNDPIVKSEQLKDIGSTWGSWKTWRSWSTDNVLCADNTKAQDLIKRAFHSVCNFYIPQKSYIFLNRPTGVKVFEGDFPDDFTKQEDVIAIHLCSQSELVLCMGFDLQEVTETDPPWSKAAALVKTLIVPPTDEIANLEEPKPLCTCIAEALSLVMKPFCILLVVSL